jgi:hypothetical protein
MCYFSRILYLEWFSWEINVGCNKVLNWIFAWLFFLPPNSSQVHFSCRSFYLWYVCPSTLLSIDPLKLMLWFWKHTIMIEMKLCSLTRAIKLLSLYVSKSCLFRILLGWIARLLQEAATPWACHVELTASRGKSASKSASKSSSKPASRRSFSLQ